MSAPVRAPGRVEFITLVAGIMMVVAFAIDSMLPALPAIAHTLGVTIPNHQQFVITAFMIGFGISQFFVGTLSDLYGRRGLMLGSLIGYSIFSLAAAIAPTFELLLLARFAQGTAAAGARVLVVSVVRDQFEGRAMAQVMSLASVVFMAAPILAPTMGALIISIAPWRWIFIVLAVVGVILWTWVFLRLPETQDVQNRKAISRAQVFESFGTVLSDRQSIGYTIAMTFMTGAVFGFLNSVQQIFDQVFRHPQFLAGGFAVMASTMAVASLVNSRIVMRWGMRPIGHYALVGFTLVAGMHGLVALSGHETLVGFIVMQATMMGCFALVVGNFGALAMEHVGEVAGTASSVQGSFSTILGAAGGGLVGQFFNGSTVPLYLASTLFGAAALAAVYIAERGKLFTSHVVAA
ncbi:multidrug effflux MFS transporter [Sphingomonas sp.]|uniref:multidrug effflux MFS transporter n=1 Tax=Sphingomonas sp. TaxID=28214 RepID=UPI0025FB092F|nr:multidrug effflux MFS transporter [Sphingomonas sp.]